MKATGIVRNVDELGRVVLPMELRKMLNIQQGTRLEVSTEGDRIVLKKYANACFFCGRSGRRVKLSDFCGKKVCSSCVDKLREELKEWEE